MRQFKVKKANMLKNSFSQYMKYSNEKKSLKIVPGRLYLYKGGVVRAGKLCSNKYRHVSFHKLLHGFVPDSDLQYADSLHVESYLRTVGVEKESFDDLPF